MRPLLLLLMPLFLAHVDALMHLLALVALLLVAKKFLMKMRRPKKKSPVTTASTPTPMRARIPPMRTPQMMMMSRSPLCSFHFLFGT
jgi:predicted ABC-type exoprotein transport system permease subunit